MGMVMVLVLMVLMVLAAVVVVAVVVVVVVIVVVVWAVQHCGQRAEQTERGKGAAELIAQRNS
jgi:Tfp pilus assembly protein PilW